MRGEIVGTHGDALGDGPGLGDGCGGQCKEHGGGAGQLAGCRACGTAQCLLGERRFLEVAKADEGDYLGLGVGVGRQEGQLVGGSAGLEQLQGGLQRLGHLRAERGGDQRRAVGALDDTKDQGAGADALDIGGNSGQLEIA